MFDFFTSLVDYMILPGFFFVPIMIVYTVCHQSKKSHEKAVQIAESQNHIVQAWLVKTRWAYEDEGTHYRQRGSYEIATYEYWWAGKTYRKRFDYQHSAPPQSLTLYFVTNPRRATFKNNLSMATYKWVKTYWAVFFILFLLERITH